jgi:ketosteroid isomerase-like protein
MKNVLSFCVFLSVITVSISAQDISILKEKVEAASKKFVNAMLNDDYETMNSMYTKDIISMPSYQPMIRGIEAIIELSEMQKQYGWSTQYFNLSMTDIIPAGNLVIEIGNYDISMSMPGNAGEWNDYGKYITIWELQNDGNLKIKIETWNTDTNPWSDMESDYYQEHYDIEE